MRSPAINIFAATLGISDVHLIAHLTSPKEDTRQSFVPLDIINSPFRM